MSCILKLIRIFSFFLFLNISLNGCIDVFTEKPDKSNKSSSETDPQYSATNLLISSNLIRNYSAEDLKTNLNLFLPNLDIQYGVNVYKIIYKTTDLSGNETQVSGLIAVPVDNNNDLSIINWNHGTAVLKNDVPSQLNDESLIGLAFAGLGYFTVLPDYLGYGNSELNFHPYLHYVSTARTIEDMISSSMEVARNLNIKLNGKIISAGYSEGGYATMALQKWIENDSTRELNLTASLPMAGPYDLLATADSIIAQDSYNSPVYVSFIFHSYNQIYNLDNLDFIFNSPYDETIEQIHNLNTNNINLSEMNNRLSTDKNILFQSLFLNQWLHPNNQYRQILNQNSVYQFIPEAPMILFHCDQDDVVPYQNAINARDFFDQYEETQTQLITLNGNNHGDCFFQAITPAIEIIKGI